MLLELTNGVQGNGNFNVVDKFLIPEQWKTMVMVNESKIRDLVDVYFEVVYPMYVTFAPSGHQILTLIVFHSFTHQVSHVRSRVVTI